ncbi:MAG: hypothetical protein Hyperionvirus36_1 [Hyperionvirus sp.]|uniref:Uncharacterized protein n=1 Tax=Hyperionvirus sp. TaxID=2487770 RepID=A0A3G5ADM9_9VIRU|nr:MAG: hypothetical protein Hyperionvirus36_1 [Hyperionvirus sp.]
MFPYSGYNLNNEISSEVCKYDNIIAIAASIIHLEGENIDLIVSG